MILTRRKNSSQIYPYKGKKMLVIVNLSSPLIRTITQNLRRAVGNNNNKIQNSKNPGAAEEISFSPQVCFPKDLALNRMARKKVGDELHREINVIPKLWNVLK